MNPGFRLLRLLLLALPVGLAAAAIGQDSAQKQTTTINYRERPQYPFDAQRLKRRPTIDGVIGEREWDPFYTVGHASVTGTTYLNWDEDNLYIAARTDVPAWTVINIDANADGWLRGTDNIELTIPPLTSSGHATISARILDGSGKETPAWNESALDSKLVQLSARALAAGQAVELAIPAGFGGITPKALTKLGVRADFLPATANPTAPPPYEPHLLLEVALVETQVTPARGLLPRLTLIDSRMTPGQELKATLELRSEDGTERKIRSVSWKGEGGAEDLVRSLREVNLPAVLGQKAVSLKYASVLPDTTPLGAYQLSCIVELEGGGTAAATASFSVVEPFAISMPNEPESISASNTGRVRIPVEIKTALYPFEYGNISIDVPAGWSVDGRDKKRFEVTKQDSTFTVSFFVNPPAGVNPGQYKFSSTVSWGGKNWHASRTLKVVRPTPADPEKKPSR